MNRRKAPKMGGVVIDWYVWKVNEQEFISVSR
jgi:hypothetical protein